MSVSDAQLVSPQVIPNIFFPSSFFSPKAYQNARTPIATRPVPLPVQDCSLQ